MEKAAIFFNRIRNTLDIWFDDPKKEFLCEKTGEEAILKKNKNGNIMGIEILNFMPKPEERIEVVKKFVHIKIVAQRS